MNELKPCPFCGSKAEIQENTVFTYPSFRAKCTKCQYTTTPFTVGAPMYKGGKFGDAMTKDEAIGHAMKRWNTRAEVSA